MSKLLRKNLDRFEFAVERFQFEVCEIMKQESDLLQKRLSTLSDAEIQELRVRDCKFDEYNNNLTQLLNALRRIYQLQDLNDYYKGCVKNLIKDILNCHGHLSNLVPNITKDSFILTLFYLIVHSLDGFVLD